MSSIAITLKPTNACNMRCRHCYHAETGFDNKMLDINLAKKLIRLATKAYSHVEILFIGGEPTLWGLDNFAAIIEYENDLCKQNNKLTFKNTIQTNGLLLNQEWINFLKSNRFSVGISYDGPHNDDLRTHGNKVLENIYLAQKMEMDFIILCVESNLSIKTLQTTYEWFKQKGFKFKILQLFMSGNALENKQLDMDADEYVAYLMEVYNHWVFDQKCNIEIPTFKSLLKVSEDTSCNSRGASCIFNRIAIHPNGEIYPCGRPYTQDFSAGHINQFNNISDMFSSSGYQKLVSINQKRLENCRDCEVFSSCKGGCISDAILEKAFSQKDNPTCIKTKKLLQKLRKYNANLYALYNEGKIQKINPRVLYILENQPMGCGC